jgi:MerR family transcriptional regulator, copper efflux regulator
MKDKMRIGELAELAGVTPRTLRYYEDLGLLGPNERAGHGFRYYTEAELHRLKKIDMLKQLGLSLEEIGEVLPLYCNDATRVRGKQRVLTNEKIDSLQRFRSELQANIVSLQEYIAKTKTD